MANESMEFTDDMSYEGWRQQHPTAFVLNTDHSFTQQSSVIHRARCDVLDLAARDTPAGRLTQGDYYKVGADSIEEIRSWLRSRRASTSARLCPRCLASEISDSGHDGCFGFEIGALYSRRNDIHGRFGGQAQGGMSTPRAAPVVLLFTGDAGLEHGYRDDWAEDGTFHYVGEGQSGDMTFAGANGALLNHGRDGKAVLLFRALGKSHPYRFMGSFELADTYSRSGVPGSDGQPRSVIVFILRPRAGSDAEISPVLIDLDPGETTATRSVEVRTKQGLFRKRVCVVETGCRVTGICDLRFLRASHMRPWSECEESQHRIDGNNGLLLAPHIDHLFDRGWISFSDEGKLMILPDLPAEIITRFGLKNHESAARPFNECQRAHLEFHRTNIFGRAMRSKRPSESQF